METTTSPPPVPGQDPQWKSGHFLLIVLAAVVFAINEGHILPAAGMIHTLVTALGVSLAGAGYQLGFRADPSGSK